ncbi:glutaredoxin 3 [Maritimibacter sp. HL-12]|uniref:glutaredoxin 3 n=1 Tax=Maritimibacter sp. HL-12 TaxID=1162418 RepID=UPI000A0F1F05|nr:glutaredoxin 3 [Maritimibacter sp. HL-12]SMH45240.1 glutaredoxin 3 [Maritimibacter sp. HL-12]
MQPVTIYTTPYCGFCIAAKRLLNKKGVEFNEIDVSHHPELRQEMMQKSGRHTVPQIWIGEVHVGGFDDMHDLDMRGKLDPLLQG